MTRRATVSGDPPVLPGEIALSRHCWDMVRQRHGIEEQHYVLHVPVPEITQDEYLAAEPRLFHELSRAGFATGTTVHGGLLSVMRLLARSPVELHGWVGYHDGGTTGVVAAGDGHANAVLATLDERTMRLRPIRPDKLAEALVDLLPPMNPARGQSITVPTDAYQNMVDRPRTEDRESGGWLQQNIPADRLNQELTAMRRLMSQPRLGGGRFYAAARDRLGRRFKSQYPITYLDLESGRWLVQQKPSDTGNPWVVAVPATPESMVAALTDLSRNPLNSMPR